MPLQSSAEAIGLKQLKNKKLKHTERLVLALIVGLAKVLFYKFIVGFLSSAERRLGI